MSGFFYYLPGVHPVSLLVESTDLASGNFSGELLADRGLGQLWDCTAAGRDLVVSEVKGNGPDGGGGALAYAKPTHGREAKSHAYNPKRQTWRLLGGAWVGWLTEEPPTLLDLLRRTTIRGIALNDASDRIWAVPIARLPQSPFGYLPRVLELDESLTPMPRVEQRYVRLWEIAGRIHEALQSGRIGEWSDVEAIEAIVDVLGFNYRVSKLELRALQEIGGAVIDDRFRQLVATIVSGWYEDMLSTEADEEEAKKKPVAPAG